MAPPGVTGISPKHGRLREVSTRGFALAGDPAKAKKTFHDFLELWKDADPDIPILQQAKAEYAKLQ